MKDVYEGATAAAAASAAAVGAVTAALATERERVSSVNASTHAVLTRLHDETHQTTTKHSDRLTTLETSASEVRIANTYMTAGLDAASGKVTTLEERVVGLREDMILGRANMTAMSDRQGMHATLQEAAMTALKGSLDAVKDAHVTTATELGVLKASHATYAQQSTAATVTHSTFKTTVETRLTAVDVSLAGTCVLSLFCNPSHPVTP